MKPNNFGKFRADPASAQPANLPSPAYANHPSITALPYIFPLPMTMLQEFHINVYHI